MAEAKARHEALYGRLAAANSQVLELLHDLPDTPNIFYLVSLLFVTS